MAQATRQRIRTCIGCATQSDKRELYRIVRSASGEVFFDGSGNAAGRGAYVCSMKCLKTAYEKGKLQRALKSAVGQEQAIAIADDLEAALSARAR